MRILGSFGAPLTALMAFCDSKIMGCGSIRPQLIRDELVWDKAIFLQKVAQRRALHPRRRRRATGVNILPGRPVNCEISAPGLSRTRILIPIRSTLRYRSKV